MPASCASFTIRLAETQQEIAAVKMLFMEYRDALGIDLCFQNIEEEFRTFPEKYDLLLLAVDEAGDPLGAVGYWTLEPGICEMKRLYVRPKARGLGLGRHLSLRLMGEAKKAGYSLMKLDTLDRLKPAIQLYGSLGFTETKAYNYNPEADIRYFEKAL